MSAGDVIKLKVIHAYKQFVHLSLVLGEAEERGLTITYVSPRPVKRLEL